MTRSEESTQSAPVMDGRADGCEVTGHGSLWIAHQHQHARASLVNPCKPPVVAESRPASLLAERLAG
ncbi:MAG: hypothetical protein OXD30_04460 [Bryobacterales bacterium]|nr:hypothetical protein [Bryobacterales bacterium]